MGSGDWLKNIISLSKVRKPKSKKTKGSSIAASNNLEPQLEEKSTDCISDVAYVKPAVVSPPVEDVAATRIQTAFRAFMAEKALRHLKRVARLQTLTKSDFGKKQTKSALISLQSWSKIQSQIKSRRLCMVEEEELRRKKLENQLKLETKLRDLEVEWSDGSHTMDEALARIQQREEAAVKRERAMAYAFSHQWRPNSRSNLGLNDSELATAHWDWSWRDRWIAARPWENRVLVDSTPKKVNSPAKRASKSSKSPPLKTSNLRKTPLNTARNRKLTYDAAMKTEDANTKT